MSSEHEIPKPGRKRRASVLTRILGHMNDRKKGALPVLIVAEMRLASDPGLEVLRDTMVPRMSKIPRFRSKLVNKNGLFTTSYFEEVELDLNYHFEAFNGGAAGSSEKVVTEEEKNQFVNDLKAWDFDVEKPVWKVIHIPQMEDGSCVVVLVVHHQIGDGNSLLYALMNKLIDPLDADELKKVSHSGKRAKQQLLLGNWGIAKAYMYGVRIGLTAPFLASDKKNPIKIKHGFVETSRVGKGKKIPVQDLKQICRAVGKGLTVNDVLLSCFTLGVFDYFAKTVKPEDIKRMVVRAQFPVDLRKRGQPACNQYGDPSNDWSLGLFTMPFDFKNYTDLLLKIKKSIDEVKVSPAHKIAKSMLPINLNIAPLQTALDFTAGVSIKNTFNLSNVIGPSQIVKIAGVDITDFSFYLFNPTACYVGLFSYNGFVTPSVNVDAQSGVDPAELGNLMYEGYEKIYKEVVVVVEKKTL